MDIYRLNRSTYMRDKLLEGFQSIIWTERFQEFGEFQLIVTGSLIDYMRYWIPEGSLITHSETNEVMIVENHTIAVDDNDGVLKDTITGRSAISILESRTFIMEVAPTSTLTIKRYSQNETLYTSIARILFDVLIANPPFIEAGVRRNPSELIPNAALTVTAVSNQMTGVFTPQRGTVWDVIKPLLITGGFGLRTVRPISNPNPNTGRAGAELAETITFDTVNGSNYAWTVADNYNMTKLRFDYREGYDRSQGATGGKARTPVVLFDFQRGDITDTSYLFSIKDWKTEMQVWTAWGDLYYLQIHDADGYTGTPLGWDSRSAYIDGSGFPKVGTSSSTDATNIKTRALATLTQSLNRLFFDGAISPVVNKYKYNVDYALGDWVTVQAEYGVRTRMRVMEYIRTQDLQGDRGYPTLILDAAPPRSNGGIPAYPL